MHLREQGHKVVLVSSGAIGVGLKRMEMPCRPKSLAGKQVSPSPCSCYRWRRHAELDGVQYCAVGGGGCLVRNNLLSEKFRHSPL